MQRVLTSEEMRSCDMTAITKGGIPGLVLMENAGRGVVDILRKEFLSLMDKHVSIFCGKGNNGGDGFVVARLLSNHAASVSVILLSPPSQLKDDAKKNYETLAKLSKSYSKNITIKKYSHNILKSLQISDLIIDALYGTGFSGKVPKPFSDVIAWMNECEKPIISVDIPSGVNGTTGAVENIAVRAQMTITFGNLKTGLLCNQGREYSGAIQLVDIGLPKSISTDKRFRYNVFEMRDGYKILPKRSLHAHKYSVGKIFVLAGSNSLTGAASLCCTAALKVGAGVVILGTPESVYQILGRKLTEVMVTPLPATTDGTISLKSIDKIQEKLQWADVVVIGPGLGQNHETQSLVLKILMDFRGKVLVDADGLNAIANLGTSKLRSMRSEMIITPHVGEFSRMTKLSSKDVELNRISQAQQFSQRYGVTIVLKGVPTVTACRDGNVVLNTTGNPGMATAGAGDVLSGIIAGLWAQGAEHRNAASCGTFLHGLSGDIAAKKLGERSIVANDLIDFLPQAVQTVELQGAE